MCMIDGAEGVDHSQVYDIKRSRKEHTCNECHRKIAVGSAYRRSELLMEGSWSTFHTCEHCMVACRWLSAQCGGWLHEGVYEDIEEHVPVYRIAGLYRLKIGMQRKWRRFDGAGLMPIQKVPRVVEEAVAA